MAAMPIGVDGFHFDTSVTGLEAELDQHPRGSAIRSFVRFRMEATTVYYLGCERLPFHHPRT